MSDEDKGDLNPEIVRQLQEELKKLAEDEKWKGRIIVIPPGSDDDPA